MPPIGPRSGSAFTSKAGIGDVWANVANLAASDNAWAQAGDGVTPITITNGLRVTGFGFAIPEDVIIVGVEVSVECEVINGTADFSSLLLIVGGVPVGDKSGPAWPVSEPPLWEENIIVRFGGPNDMWGITLSPSQVNAEDFGMELSAQSSGGSPIVTVDHITITVYVSGSNSISGRHVTVGDGVSRSGWI